MALVHRGVGFLCGGVVQLLGNMESVEIGDMTAAGADEVDMGIDVAVITLDSVHGAQADDQPLILKQGNVAVDRPKGQVRDLGLQGRVHRFSRRVLVGGPQIG